MEKIFKIFRHETTYDNAQSCEIFRSFITNVVTGRVCRGTNESKVGLYKFCKIETNCETSNCLLEHQRQLRPHYIEVSSLLWYDLLKAW